MVVVVGGFSAGDVKLPRINSTRDSKVLLSLQSSKNHFPKTSQGTVVDSNPKRI